MAAGRATATSMDLFVGAGGLALGTARAGFQHVAVLDWDRNSCTTLRRNKADGVDHVRDWDIVEGDVRNRDFKKYEGRVHLVSGGPPCQPFSIGGKHLGHTDDRNLFPAAIRAIRDIQPKGFMFENVKGLLRPSFATTSTTSFTSFAFLMSPGEMERDGPITSPDLRGCIQAAITPGCGTTWCMSV